MATVTVAERLAEKRTRLEAYRQAELKALQAQEYGIKDKSLQRANLKTIRDGIQQLEKEIARLERGGGIPIKRVLLRDL